MYETANIVDFSGKTVLVTGAGGGIGREIAARFAASSTNLIITGRSGEKLEAMAREIREHGGDAIPIAADLSNAAAVANLFEAVRTHVSRLDVLVNCAGRVQRALALTMSEADWQAMFSTNVSGLFFCCQQAAGMMIPGGSGSIVNIASTLGIVGLEERAAYIASKGAVIALTKALAIEWSKHGIRVNAVAPTTTLTGDTADLYTDDATRTAKLTEIPLGRFGTPADSASAVLFLASDAASFVTGHTLVVDGGYTAR
jgi:2-deoxy-D-gluconate 3-dehydrogenase